MNKQEKDALEALVDRYSMTHVVEALSEIAFDKSVHIAENWQDVQLAKVWSTLGDLIAKFAAIL